MKAARMIDAEKLKMELPDKCEKSFMERIIDAQPTVATALDEVAGSASVIHTTEAIAFSKDYVKKHYKTAIEEIMKVVNDNE